MSSPDNDRPRFRRPRTVEVSGVGRASGVPDVVRLALGIRCDADGVAAALGAVADRVRAVGTAARGQGVGDRDVRSVGAGVYPRYDKNGQKVVGYTANHQLQVVVTRIDTVSAVIEAVATAAGNSLSVDSVQLDLQDKTPLEHEARDLAFAEARVKAEQYAALSGAGLGQALAVVETPVGGGPHPMPRMAMAARESAASFPVEAGEQSVAVAVSVQFELVGGEGSTGSATSSGAATPE